MKVRRYVGLVSESVHGTPKAAKHYLDPESSSLDSASDQASIFAGASGLDRQVAPAPYMVEGDIVAALDDIISGFYFYHLLGQYSTVGTPVAGGGNSDLTAPAAAGATQIQIDSNLNFEVEDEVQIGTGNTAEVQQIQQIEGEEAPYTITLMEALRFDHEAEETVQQVTGKYTHIFTKSLVPLLLPFTARVGKDLFEHVFSGCVLDSLEIEIAADIIKATLGIAASKDSKGVLPADVDFNEGNIFAPHNVTASINGEDASVRVEELNLSIANNADLESGRTIGARFPRRGYRGALEVTGDISLAFIDTAELERFWGSHDGPTSGELIEFPLTINIGENLDISFPRVVYTSMGQPLGGRDRIEQEGSFQALVDASGEGPVIITLVNDLPRV